MSRASEPNVSEPNLAASDSLGSFLRDLGALFWDPVEAFRTTARAPRVYAPLLVFVGQQLLFTAVWLHNLDLVEFLRHEALVAGQPAPDPASISVGLYRGLFWFSAVVLAPGLLFLIAGICMLVLNVFTSARVGFRQSLSVVLQAYVAPYFMYLPLTLLVMALRGDWNLAPHQVLQSSLAALCERDSTGTALYTLAESMDVFSFWTLGLLATGYRAVTRCSVLGPLVSLWLLWVLLRAGFTVLTG